jgi:VanZ family protein
MAFIFWLGADQASAPETRSLLEKLLRFCLPAWYERLSPDTLVTLNVLFRKGGHFLGYALLGLLDARALRAPGATLKPRPAVIAWGAATAWAAVDEFHQSFSPSRGATLEDVLLDSFGAAMGVLFYSLWTRRKTHKS